MLGIIRHPWIIIGVGWKYMIGWRPGYILKSTTVALKATGRVSDCLPSKWTCTLFSLRMLYSQIDLPYLLGNESMNGCTK